MENTNYKTAKEYTGLGLSVIPVYPANHPEEGLRKTPKTPWKPFQQRYPTGTELQKYFTTGADIAIVCGLISGNLEVIDFDEPSLFTPYMATLKGINPSLVDKLIIADTPSGGFHIFYRCEGKIGGNQKLAMSLDNKKVFIETRGEGGYCLADPSAATPLL